MKFYKLLHNYFRGIRGQAILVALVLCVTAFVGVYTSASIQYITDHYTVVNSCADKNLYYFTRLYTFDELSADPELLHKEVAQAVEACGTSSVIEHIYTTQTVNLFKYNKKFTSIVLLDPKLMDVFPGLAHIGYDFSSDPNGCILGNKIFNDFSGQTIKLSVAGGGSNESIELAVNGHISSPYMHMSFSRGGTKITVEHMFQDSQCVIALANEDLLAQLRSYNVTMRYDPNYIIEFSQSATQEEVAAALAALEAKGTILSIGELLEQTREELQDALKQKLPTPMFLLIAATAAYLGAVLLILRKKGKELAYYYLCGASRAQCVTVAVAASCIVSLPMLILNTLIVLLAPEYDWLRAGGLSELTVSSFDLAVVAGYYLLTVLISLVVTFVSMARNTPLTYLRGAE